MLMKSPSAQWLSKSRCSPCVQCQKTFGIIVSVFLYKLYYYCCYILFIFTKRKKTALVLKLSPFHTTETTQKKWFGSAIVTQKRSFVALHYLQTTQWSPQRKIQPGLYPGTWRKIVMSPVSECTIHWWPVPNLGGLTTKLTRWKHNCS